MSSADSSSDTPESRLAAAVADSWILATIEGLDDWIGMIERGKRATQIRLSIRGVVINSFVYRWLTAEPEPMTVVIDLRESLIVGSIFSAIGPLFERTIATADNSRSVTLLKGLFAEFRLSPVRLIGAATALVCATILLGGVVLDALGMTTAFVLATFAVVGLAAMRTTDSCANSLDR